jgi:hypothetical protein
MSTTSAATSSPVAASDMPSVDGVPVPSSGWTGTIVRVLSGVIWAIDAFLKWLPGYRDSDISSLKTAAQGQPSWLHWWFHFLPTSARGSSTPCCSSPCWGSPRPHGESA